MSYVWSGGGRTAITSGLGTFEAAGVVCVFISSPLRDWVARACGAGRRGTGRVRGKLLDMLVVCAIGWVQLDLDYLTGEAAR